MSADRLLRPPAGVPSIISADSGNSPFDSADFSIGTVCVDMENDEFDPFVVTILPGEPCTGWDAYYDKDNEEYVTIAEDNPNSIWSILPLRRAFSGMNHFENAPPHLSILI